LEKKIKEERRIHQLRIMMLFLKFLLQNNSFWKGRKTRKSLEGRLKRRNKNGIMLKLTPTSTSLDFLLILRNKN
jgi:hypothetical protein